MLAPVDAKLKRRAADGGQKGTTSAPKRPRPAPTLPPSPLPLTPLTEKLTRVTPSHLLRSVRFLLDARRACEYSITTYHELVQVLNLRHARELGPDEAATRAARTLRSQPPLLDELAAQAAPERQPALVAAALALHGAEPLTAELPAGSTLSSPTSTSRRQRRRETARGWPLHDGGGDGGLKFPVASDALDEGGMQPPASWVGGPRLGRGTDADGRA